MMENSVIDLIAINNEFEIEGKKIEIEEKIEGTVLLQQYKRINKGNSIQLTKGEYGSIPKRIPRIYEKI